jgi:hypothetical protein
MGISTAKSTISLLSSRKVGLVAAGGEDVVEHGADLRLAPAAAGFYVGKQALDVADLGGDRLHVAHGFLHRGELVDDAGETGGHLLLDRLVQLLVHGLFDLGELGVVGLAQLAQAGVEQGAGEFGLLGGLVAFLGQGGAQMRLFLGQQGGQAAGAFGLLRAQVGEAFEQGAFGVADMAAGGFAGGVGAGAGLFGQQTQALQGAPLGDDDQDQHQQRNQQDGGGECEQGRGGHGCSERRTSSLAQAADLRNGASGGSLFGPLSEV